MMHSKKLTGRGLGEDKMRLFDRIDNEMTISLMKVSEYPEFRKELIFRGKNISAYDALMAKLTQKLNYCLIK